VDGGLQSLCNLDLLEASDLDVVICFSAMTARLKQDGSSPVQRAVHSLFGLAREQLDRQVSTLMHQGVDTVVVEPTANDHAAMGANLMDAGRWRAVVDVALTSVARQLRHHSFRTRLGALRGAA
jgi:hypothetical protein